MRRLLLATAAMLGTGCSLVARHESDPLPAGTGTIVRPVDGDTAIVRLGGHDERVRFIGIDTPESVSEQVAVECYGPEAKHRTADLLPPGTRVRLERDEEARDTYGRLLAYVYLDADGTFVNLVLVQEGFAESFPFPPNTAHQADFDAAQAEAQSHHRGLWPTCGGTDTPAKP